MSPSHAEPFCRMFPSLSYPCSQTTAAASVPHLNSSRFPQLPSSGFLTSFRVLSPEREGAWARRRRHRCDQRSRTVALRLVSSSLVSSSRAGPAGTRPKVRRRSSIDGDKRRHRQLHRSVPLSLASEHIMLKDTFLSNLYLTHLKGRWSCSSVADD